MTYTNTVWAVWTALWVALIPCYAQVPVSEAAMITPEEAERVVYSILSEGAKHLPGLTFLPSIKKMPARCSGFEVLWDNRGEGSVNIGFWVVDRRTAEIWEDVLCTRESGEDLRCLQKSIRNRLGVSDFEVREVLARSPCCTPDPSDDGEPGTPE